MGTGRVYSDTEPLFHGDLWDTEHPWGSSSTKEVFQLSWRPGRTVPLGKGQLSHQNDPFRAGQKSLTGKKQREDTRQFPTDPHTAKASLQGEKFNYSWKKFL